jgi:hypothetical protein
MSRQNDSNSVGYKQPPKSYQFRPGQSGNPNGRPKGTRNFKSDLRDELNETISVSEGGREVTISKQRAFIKRLVASAIAGDARAVNTLMSFCARAFGDDDDEQQLSPEDRQIAAAFPHRPVTVRNEVSKDTPLQNSSNTRE